MPAVLEELLGLVELVEFVPEVQRRLRAGVGWNVAVLGLVDVSAQVDLVDKARLRDNNPHATLPQTHAAKSLCNFGRMHRLTPRAQACA